MTDHIEITRRDGVLAVRMNRPDKKNALTSAMYAAMAEALLSADGDGSVGAILFLGLPGPSRPATTSRISRASPRAATSARTCSPSCAR